MNNGTRLQKTDKRWIGLMVLILLLAVLLRLWSIDKESFWADEGWSMVLSKGATLSDVTLNMVNDQHPPLYFILLHYWNALLGNSELISRLLSAFWSLIGIALAYRFGREAFGSPLAGLFAALVLALADNDIMMAQETRHYTQMTALALLSGLFYLRYCRRPSRGAGLGWFAASVALMVTHYLGAFVLVVQLLHSALLITPFRRKVDHVIRLILIGMAWLPWGFVFLNQSAVRYTRPIIYLNSIPNTPETFITIRTDLFGAQFALMFGLMLLGLMYVRYQDGRPELRWRPLHPTAYLLLWVALPVVVIVALNTRLQILTPRNFLLITPAIALLIGHGLTNLDRSARRFLVGVIVAFGLTTVDSYFVKPPWRAVSRDVLAYRLDGEPVIMDAWVDGFALRHHLGRDLGVDPDTLPLVFVPEWDERYRDQFHARLLEYLKPHNSVWLVQWSKDQFGLLTFLDTHGYKRTATQIETHLGTNIINIWRYDRDPQASAATFGGVLTLQRVDYPRTVNAGEVLPVALWWKVSQKPEKEYSTSVFLLDANGVLVAQQDGPPLAGKDSMINWQTGDLRFDRPKIALSKTIPPGTYTLALKVYFYADPKPLDAVPGGEYFAIGSVSIR
jgi:hypothetical protein